MANFQDALMQFLQSMQAQQGAGSAPPSPMQAMGGGMAAQPQAPMPVEQPPVQPQPFAPGGAQNAGAGPMADGAQMPMGIMEGLLKRIFGMQAQAQGQQVNNGGGLGQIMPDYAQPPMPGSAQ